MLIGVDIGGTKTDCVLVGADGRIVAEHHQPTRPADGIATTLDRIASAIRVLLEQATAPVTGVGIGCPGHVDSAAGMAHRAVNLGWEAVPLRAEIARRLPVDVPIAIDNDVRAAALGERCFGAAQGQTDFVHIAIGTGLGTAACVNGALVTGAHAVAMEMGHLIVEPGGRLCGCGMHGCAEMYASGRGLLAGVAAHRAAFPHSALPDPATTAAVIAAARAGDPLAQQVMDEAGTVLGRVMAVCASVLNPAMIVVGGGLGLAAADLLLGPAQAALRTLVWPELVAGLDVVLARTPRVALGAACLAAQHLAQSDGAGPIDVVWAVE